MLSLKEIGFKGYPKLKSIAINLPILIIVNFEGRMFIINSPSRRKEYYTRLGFEGYPEPESESILY